MEKDIGKIAKNEQTDIVVGVREFNGKVGVDIREFVTGERYTGPTKKGLRIPADKFVEFRELINNISLDDLKSSAEDEGQETLDAAGKKEDEEEE